MITLCLLLIMLLIIAIVVIATIGIGGVAFFIVFGDLFVSIYIVYRIIKHFLK